MYNCVFSGHCFEYAQCDKSCPALAQTSYLLERNGISMTNEVFRTKPDLLAKYSDILSKCRGSVRTVFCDTSTIQVADILTYLGICETWKGSQLHCTTYNLKFAQYIDALQKSWGNAGQTSESEYMKIWATSAKILIISNMDYINFKDFQCQTLLSLLQSRMSSELTTIIVSPKVSSLVGDGPFFARLCELLKKQKVV